MVSLDQGHRVEFPSLLLSSFRKTRTSPMYFKGSKGQKGILNSLVVYKNIVHNLLLMLLWSLLASKVLVLCRTLDVIENSVKLH